MACASPLNSPDGIATPPNAFEVTKSITDESESFGFEISDPEDSATVCPDLPLKEIVKQVFESNSVPLLIAFFNGVGSRSRLPSQPVPVAVRASVLQFTWDELAARVSSLPKMGIVKVGNMACLGDVHIDFSSMEVRRSSGEQIAMTAQEFKVLKFFVENPGRVISRDELLNRAWGYENYPTTRTVDNHVLKLRQKLEIKPSRPKHFLTVHSVGYKFLP
jgi:hypothetical protein